MSVVKNRNWLTELVALSLVAILSETSFASQLPSRSADSPAVSKPKEVVTKLTCEVVLTRREDGAQIEKNEGELFVDVRESRRSPSPDSTFYLLGIVGAGVASFRFPLEGSPLSAFAGTSDDFVWQMSDVMDSGKGGLQRVSVSINRVSGGLVYQEVRRTSQDPEEPADEELSVKGRCMRMGKDTRKF